MAAGALFVDAAGRVLLVRPTYKPHWDIPGGYVEPGESPRAACVREIREELGIAPTVGAHLVVDWAPADDEGDKILFIFDGGTLSDVEVAGITPAADELAEVRYVDPADLDQYLAGRLSRRIRTALEAKRIGRAAYAEHGDDAR
jgi:8-oxo-dGTP pyrophosphatase MutT (NUDIX family)